MSSYLLVPLEVFGIGAVISMGIALLINTMLIVIKKVSREK